jgi:metal-responsive CopG/Arc/MetJ family transcriptional regulator
MKTAISVPDELFESAEQFAQRQGMSRSELYATALRYYLHKHRSEGITQRLDEIYSTDDGVLDPAIARLQARSLPKDAW